MTICATYYLGYEKPEHNLQLKNMFLPVASDLDLEIKTSYLDSLFHKTLKKRYYMTICGTI